MIAGAPAKTVLQHIRDLVDGEATKGLTDAQLLERFSVHREESAFAALLHRHGRLVWGVCRNILRIEQDAEDAFQATFLVLARQPASILKKHSVGSWLYGVAFRVAMKAKKKMNKRQARERGAVEQAADRTANDLAWRELQAILDEEIQRLPEVYRAPFVLCCLEGTTREAASRELGLSQGTISSRIARARQTLQNRLVRRGVGLPAALCAHAVWTESTYALVPPALVMGTLKAACGVREASTAALALAKGVGGSTLAKWQAGAVLALTLGLLSVVGANWAGRTASLPPAEPVAVQPEVGPAVKKDAHGDALPGGAVARLGTLRYRAPGSQIAVTADGKEIVAVDAALLVRRFDARTGELLATSQLPGSPAPVFRISPRGTFVLSQAFSSKGQVQLELWNVAQGKKVQTLACGEYWIFGANGIAFAPDESQVVLAPVQGSRERKVVLWDLQTFKTRDLWLQEKEIYEHYFDPVAVFSPNGRRVLVCHHDLTIRCWDTESCKLLWESERRQMSALLCFSPDSQTIVCESGIGIGPSRIDANTGKPSKETLKPPKEALYHLGLSPDGKWMAFENGFGEMLLWQPGSAKVDMKLPAPPHLLDTIYRTINQVPTNFAFTADSKAIIRRNGALERWDLTSGKPAFVDAESRGHTEEVSRLVFSPDGRLLASSAQDQSARLWDVATGRALHVFGKNLGNHLAFAPDGRTLFAGPFDGRGLLREWDAVGGRVIRTLEGPERAVLSSSADKEIRITPDGRQAFLLTMANGGSSAECILTTLDLQAGKCEGQKKVPWGADSIITPDGKSVVAVDHGSNSIRLWDLNAATHRFQFQTDRAQDTGRHVYMWDLAVSPSGRLMAEHSLFRRGRSREDHYDDLRIGEMDSGRQLAKLPYPDQAEFAFSADDCLLAVAVGNQVHFWETASWKEVGSIKLADDSASRVRSLAFSPDGRTLATGHADSTILLWDTTLRGGTRGGALDKAQIEVLWTALAGADAVKAYAAMWRMTDDPKQALALLDQKLQAVAAAPPEVVGRLLTDMDSSKYSVRMAADKALRDLGAKAEPAIRAALKANPTLEMRQRLEAILKTLDPWERLTGDTLREVRAVQVLERIATPDARNILERLAKGAPMRLNRAAQEALGRLTP
jgi:RNA polymerase sigma factor (sigma-70 family)